MSLYGKQPYFCNACGKRVVDSLPNVIGRKWRVCSVECLRIMNDRYTRSVIGISEPQETSDEEPTR